MAVEDVFDQVVATPALGVRRSWRQGAIGLVRAARPHQWTKNLLVFAVPGAAGMLGDASVLRTASLAFAAFCLASSGTYLVNDVIDVEADRRHPTKHLRPLQGSAHQHPSGWTAASAVPFVMGIMRYGLLLEKGHGEEPEQVVLGDHSLLVIGAVWLALIVAGVLG